MTALIVAIGFTIGVSALCSILEAMILSTTPTDIQLLKSKNKKVGEILEHLRNDLEETTSAILSLNTIANTLGSILVGGLAVNLFGDRSLIYFSIGMTVGILVFSEVIPKNVGVIYRNKVHATLVRPLQFIRMMMRPISYLCKIAVVIFVRKSAQQDVSDEDIRLMAEKSEKEGNLTQDERQIITNALSLDEIQIGDIMTPRTVVMALEATQSIHEVFENDANLPFARIPVYDDNIDTIIGIVRRRDLLKSKANDEDARLVREFMNDPLFVVGTRTAGDALQSFLKTNQQLAIVLDEYGSVQGVVTMEDVIEHILGKEIFEEDDLAVDMREYAKSQKVSNKTATHHS